MTRAFLRCCALTCLCLLLVYAPEIFTAVSAPYQQTSSPRTLLRIVLCTQDEQAVSSLYKMLAGYQKQQPAVHLRMTRADTQQILTLPSPLPDLYLFPESLLPALSDRLLPQYHPYPSSDGTALLLGVSKASSASPAAYGFFSYIQDALPYETPAPDF